MKNLHELAPAIVLTSALALGLTACGETAVSETGPNTQSSQKDREQVNIKYAYFDNGTRITSFNSKFFTLGYADILSYCDGPDMVSQTYGIQSGHSIAIQPLAPACEDGMITVEDYPASADVQN